MKGLTLILIYSLLVKGLTFVFPIGERVNIDIFPIDERVNIYIPY